MKRTVLVTGASGGIGSAICKKLLEGGYKVIGIGRDFSGLDHLSKDHGGSFTSLQIDMAGLDTLPDQLAAIKKEFPDIDSIICCAGQGRFGSLEEFSYEQINDLMSINFLANAYVVRAFIPSLKQNKRGDIIIIGSEAALSGGRKGAVYCASKFALRGFGLSLREECSSKNIRVSMINPGAVDTSFFDGQSFAPGDDEANFIEPDDIANVVDLIFKTRTATVFDEINLSPLKKVLQFKKISDD